MDPISLRSARASDAVAIAHLHIASWRDAYASFLDPDYLAGPIEADRLAVWRGQMHDPQDNQVVTVAETVLGEIAGFVCSYRDDDPDWGSLVDNLHVWPALRGQHIGGCLLRAAAADLDGPMYLWVFEENGAALRFYERLGGRVVERGPSEIAPGKPSLRVHWTTSCVLL